MDTRRTMLWVIFSVSLLFLWDSWQRHNLQPSMFFASPAAPSTTPPAAGAPPKGAVSDVPVPSQLATVPASNTPPIAGTGGATAATAATEASRASETVRIETDVYRLDFDTLGAEVKRVELLKHRDDVDTTTNMVLLDSSSNRVYLAQTGLIGGVAGASLPTHRTLFTWLPGPSTLEPGKDELTVSFAAESGGVRLVKTFVLKRSSYEISVRHEVSNLGSEAVTPQLYLQLVRDGNSPAGESQLYMTFTGMAVYTDAQKFQKQSFSDIEKGKGDHARQANDGWIAIIQHYFVSAWVPTENALREIYTEKIGPNLYRVGAKLPLAQIQPGTTLTNTSRLFVGPQEERMLEKVAPGLELVRDYGWLTVLAKPLFWLLEKIHGFTGNWGWAIVVLTIIIKLVFFPLSAASYKSMARMRNLAPRMKVLQEQHKGDRAKLNQAMMEMYRNEKINPMGGCLPILVQIPVFIALYWTLLASVEMRNAPWIGWIKDLAVPDPWFILPFVMMASMFVQYKLNPAPPDPLQAKIMLWMPLVFGVMFFFFPAGLVLYWVVNNLLSIAQQWQITRMIESGKGDNKPGKGVRAKS